MSNIRRYFRSGDISFLTHVTYQRTPILVENFDLLWDAIARYRSRFSFDLIAWVVMPDHFHMLISQGKDDISSIIRRIKLSFSYHFRERKGMKSGRVWQYRFWDHIIRDEEDLSRHIDYIHYNPVKHKIKNDPFDYPHSSLTDYFRQGYYTRDWGIVDKIDIDGDFGE